MEDSPYPFQSHHHYNSRHGHGGFPNNHLIPNSPTPPFGGSAVMSHGAVDQHPQPTPQPMPRPHVTPLRHPLATPPPTAANDGDPRHPRRQPLTASAGDAGSARREWRRHGAGLTQQVEEIRRRDEARPGTLTARLASAETRRDVAGNAYTAYLLDVRLPRGGTLRLGRRYSEFARLRDQFRSHGCDLDASAAPFPGRHAAGRIGNWTPSLQWAPQSHDDLVALRAAKLDVWLTHVCERYNVGDLPHSLARAVGEFLTLSDRPPCEMENHAAGGDDGGGGGSVRWNNPISFTLGSSIRQACRSVEEMCLPEQRRGGGSTAAGPAAVSSALQETDQSIPLDLLHCARGLIFLTVLKAGLVVSGRVGTGLLIARNDDDDDEIDDPRQRWSAPVALGTIGMGWGMLAGGDITHYLVVLTTEAAVEAMLRGTVQLGTEIGVAAGPVGRSSQVSASASQSGWTLHPAYSYAHSQGLFVGMSLEGSILSARHDVNAKFYGRAGLTPDEVLDLPPPKAAEPLYRILEHALATEIPHEGFRPSHLLFPERRDRSKTFRDSQFFDPSSSVHAGLPPVDGYGRVSLASSGCDGNGHQTSPDSYYGSRR